MNKFILVVILMFGSAQAGFCQSYGRSVDTQFFSAKVVNIDKTRSGKLFVTIEFAGKVLRPSFSSQIPHVRLYRGPLDCAKSATLLDSDGNEYGTNRCLAHESLTGAGGGEGLMLVQNSTSQVVFEFTTPLANRATNKPTYSLIVPISYEASTYPMSRGQTSLSFFQLSAN